MKGDDKIHHHNSTNCYIRKFPDGFFNCLGCGYNSYIFREYKDYRVTIVRRVYWQELWSYVLKTWENPSSSFTPEVSVNSITLTPPPPFVNHSPLSPISSSSTNKHDLCLGSRINNPAWKSIDKRPRFYLFLYLFLIFLRLIKNLGIYRLITLSLVSIYISVL